jgi:RNA polymerase primary sigma factor
LLPGEIDRLLDALTDREEEIVRLRFGLSSEEPRTLEEIGERLNVSRERVRQIESRALSKLRNPVVDTGARHLLTC